MIDLPPRRIEVFGSTANVHSTSLFRALPATTMLSADAAFTVPLAFLSGVFFIAAGLSAFVSGVGVCAKATPAEPAANTSATTRASSFFTTVPPPRKGLKNHFRAYDERRSVLILRPCIDEIYQKERAVRCRRPPFRKFRRTGLKRCMPERN